MRKMLRNVFSLQLVVTMILSSTGIQFQAMAEDCLHTNLDRLTIPTYEIIVGNNDAHNVVVWMQTTCLDCWETLDDVPLTTTEEPHQFEADGSFLTCKWCAYETTEEAVEATATPTAQPTVTPTPTPVPTATPTPTPKPTATPVPTLLKEEYSSGDYKYKIYSNGDAVITDYTGSATNLLIPYTLDGHKVTEIGHSAFSESHSLISVTLPNGVTSIGVRAFDYCKNLRDISFPNGLSKIGSYAFFQCENLGSIVIPNGVTSIEECTFYYCFGLKSVTIPNSVTSIGAEAFKFCYGLTSITIPSSVTQIGHNPFEICESLQSIQVASGNKSFGVTDGCLIDLQNHTLISYPAGCSNSQYVIPDNVRKIGSHAFGGSKNLTGIAIPSGVTSIGDRSFQFCSNLTSVTISDSVTSIGEGAFFECYNLTSLTIPDSVTNIEAYAFWSNFPRPQTFTLTVARGSYAEDFAKRNNISYQYAEPLGTPMK